MPKNNNKKKKKKKNQTKPNNNKSNKKTEKISYEGQGLGRGWVYVEASFRQGKGPVSGTTLLEKALVGGWGLGSS